MMNLDYETRSEEDPIEQATAAVEELRSGFSDFRTRTDERLERGFREIGDRVTNLETRLGRPGSGHEQRGEDDAELQLRAFDRFLRYGRDVLSPDEVRALDVGDTNSGEGLVPENFLREIVKQLTEISPMRSLARVTNVSGTPVLLPRRTGKPTGAWEGETTDAGETSSTYDQWSIDVFEARVFTDISNRLLEDSAFDMSAEIREDLADAFEELESAAFVNGSGVGEPQGLMTDTDFVTVDSGDSFVDPEDLIGLFYSLKSRYRGRGTWAMNGQTIAEVRKLKYGDGKHLWADSLAEGQPPTLLGRPVEEFPDLPDVGSETVPIVFGDFNRAYTIVQRLRLVVVPDRYTQAHKSTVRFHARMRVGGKLVLPEAVKGLKMPV